MTDDRRVRLAVGGAFAFSIGIAKELWDLEGHGDPSWRDLTWDAVGTVTGLAVAAAVDCAAEWMLGKAHVEARRRRTLIPSLRRLRRRGPHLNLVFQKLKVIRL